MIINQTIAYIFARGIPGLINFTALATYSHLLTAEEYGNYSITLTAASMIGVIFYQWQRLVLSRWLAGFDEENKIIFLSNTLYIYIFLSSIIAITALTLLFMSNDINVRLMIILGAVCVITTNWNELNLTLASAEIKPKQYGKLFISKVLFSFFIGVLLITLNYKANGPIIGIIVGSLASSLIFGLEKWRKIRPKCPNKEILNRQLGYGFPLILTFGMSWVTASSDRLLIGWLLNIKEAGQYAVSYDIGQNSLGVLLAIAQVATYPLAIKAIESKKNDVAEDQIKKNGQLIFTIALSGAAGLAALSTPIGKLFVGNEFKESVSLLLPLISFAAALGSIKSFYFDSAFHYGKNSRGVLISDSITAITNILLNIMLIPVLGLKGAAWSTLISYGIGSITSSIIGRHTYKLPNINSIIIKPIIISICTFLATYLTLSINYFELHILTILGILSGGSTTLILAYAFNVANFRNEYMFKSTAKSLFSKYRER